MQRHGRRVGVNVAPANDDSSPEPYGPRRTTGQRRGRNPEIEGLLGESPRWIVRWGGAILLVVIALAIWLTASIRSPDLVIGSAVLTTAAPPAIVVPTVDGRIDSILVADRSRVGRNQTVAVIANAAATADVESLRQWLRRATRHGVDRSFVEDVGIPPKGLVVGSIQDAYAALRTAYASYEFVVRDNVSAEQRRALRAQIEEQDALVASNAQRIPLAEQDVALAQRAVNRLKLLRQKGFATDVDVEIGDADFIRRKASLIDGETNWRASAVRRRELQVSLLEATQQHQHELADRAAALEAAIDQGARALLLWEQSYVLKAPVAGVVSMLALRPQAQVRQGEPVLGVVSSDTILHAEASIPPYRSARVRPGQRVRLSFPGYGDNEVGVVRGVVQAVSLLPQDSVRVVTIALPQGLRTTYGIDLKFQQRMQASAEIVTGDVSVLERILGSLRILRARLFSS